MPYCWAWGNANGTMGRNGVYGNIPTSYATAHALLFDRRGRETDERKLGYETLLWRADDAAIVLTYFRTGICRFYPDESVRVTTGGWQTSTTKARINAALYGSPWSIGSERGVWYWYRQGEGYSFDRFCEFEDGDRVFLTPGLPGQDGIFQPIPAADLARLAELEAVRREGAKHAA